MRAQPANECQSQAATSLPLSLSLSRPDRSIEEDGRSCMPLLASQHAYGTVMVRLGVGSSSQVPTQPVVSPSPSRVLSLFVVAMHATYRGTWLLPYLYHVRVRRAKSQQRKEAAWELRRSNVIAWNLVSIGTRKTRVPISQLKLLAVAHWTGLLLARPSTVNPLATALINNGRPVGRLDDGSSVIRALNTSLIPPVQGLLHADVLVIMTSEIIHGVSCWLVSVADPTMQSTPPIHACWYRDI
jgi:hypothetical protein